MFLEAAVKQAVDNNVVDLGLTRNAAGVEDSKYKTQQMAMAQML